MASRFLRRSACVSLSLLGFVFVGCGGGGGGGGSSTTSPTTPTPAAPTITGVTVTGPGCTASTSDSGSKPTLCQATTRGATVQLVATATFSDNSTQTVTSQAQWASSNTNVATVTAAGLVTIVGAGDSDVLATYQGKTGGQTVRATLPPLISPAVRGTTSQGLQVLIEADTLFAPFVHRFAVVVQFTLNDGRVATLVTDSNGRANIGSDGSFRMTSGSNWYEGVYHSDGSVAGNLYVVSVIEGRTYTATLTYTGTPSTTAM